MSYPHSFMAYKMLLVLYFVRAQQQFPCSSSCIIQDSSGNVMFDFSQFLNRKDLVSDDSSDHNYRLNVCGQVDWGCTGGQTFGSAVETSDLCYFLGVGESACSFVFYFIFLYVTHESSNFYQLFFATTTIWTDIQRLRWQLTVLLDTWRRKLTA